MGIFGRGEGYSKREYDWAAEKEKNLTDETKKRHAELAGETDATTREYIGSDMLPYMEKKRKAAHDRVQELFNLGHKEAKGLNKEYDRLWQRAQEALDALGEFEMSRLGMKKTGSRHVREEKFDRSLERNIISEEDVPVRVRKVEKTNP